MRGAAPRAALLVGAVAAALSVGGCRRGRGELVTALPNESYSPECAAIDATHVYWTASGHVFRARREGSAVEDFASTPGRPKGIAARGPDVWWIDEATSTLFAKSKAGGAARVVAKLSGFPSAWCTLEDDGAIYAAGAPLLEVDGGVHYLGRPAVAVRVDKATGARTELAHDDGDLTIAIDATHVYVQSMTRRYDVRRIPKSGGAAQALNTRDPRLDPPTAFPAPPGFGFERSTLAIAGGRVHALAGDSVFVLPTTGGVPEPAQPTTGARALSPGKGGVCVAEPFAIECVDARGARRSFAKDRSVRWLGADGDDLFWFESGAALELRRAKL